MIDALGGCNMQITTTQMKKWQEERIEQFRRLSQSDHDASVRAARESLQRAGLIDSNCQPTERYR